MEGIEISPRGDYVEAAINGLGLGVHKQPENSNSSNSESVLQAIINELMEVLVLLQRLNPTQLQALLQFIHGGDSSSSVVGAQVFQIISGIVQRARPSEIGQLIALNSKSLDEEQKENARKSLKRLFTSITSSDGSISEKDIEDAFNVFILIFQLQGLLRGFSILHLMKFFELMPPGPPLQQLQLLQQVQQLFSQLQPDALHNLHNQLEKTSQQQPGTEHQQLVELLNLPSEYFQLYQPLRLLLQLDWEELLTLQQALPKIQQPQMLQLLQLLQLQPFDVLELRNLFNLGDSIDAMEEGGVSGDILQLLDSENPPISQTPMGEPSIPHPEKSTSLQIVEQPPEKSVYKRNLKPNPMVMVHGSSQSDPGNLYVTPVLVRCDTFQEETKFLTGNKPVKATPGRVLTFKKLKITTTSHQQQETLFCLRFELRKYSTNPEEDDTKYEILDSIHSNPVCVLSHSTQMKPVPSIAPTITDAVPESGPTTGGTRVAILGSNFVDSPAARIRFDNTDVMPIFHAPGTLICHTPQHSPGTVQVRVCNSNKKWSETFATFTYSAEALPPYIDHQLHLTTVGGGIGNTGNIFRADGPGIGSSVYGSTSLVGGGNSGNSLSEAVLHGNFSEIQVLCEKEKGAVNLVDRRSYTPLFYASVLDDGEICKYLLDQGARVDIQDKEGFSPLHWASWEENQLTIEILVERGGANVNMQTNRGYTPLHLAILQGSEDLVQFFVQNGAWVNIPDIDEQTPLHMATATGNVQLVELLLDRGAYINSVDDFGESCLHYAVRDHQMEIAKVLLDRRISQIANEDGEFPFDLAFSLGDEEMVKLLLQYGSSLNRRTAEGETPLHQAVKDCNEPMVRLLIDNGADVNQKNQMGFTVADICKCKYSLSEATSLIAEIIAHAGGERSSSLPPCSPFKRKYGSEYQSLMKSAKAEKIHMNVVPNGCLTGSM